MKESIGSTVHFNIVITFIVIVFAFISISVIYYKSNKVGNFITDSIEKYEGYNSLAKSEIDRRLNAIGYNKTNINCASSVSDSSASGGECMQVNLTGDDSSINGYCVYYCEDTKENNYYYKIRTNMMINIPIINSLINFPVYSTTKRMYDFETGLGVSEVEE